jgi:hypothetical protein
MICDIFKKIVNALLKACGYKRLHALMNFQNLKFTSFISIY